MRETRARKISLQVGMTHEQVSRISHELTRTSFSYEFLVRGSWALENLDFQAILREYNEKTAVYVVLQQIGSIVSHTHLLQIGWTTQ